MSDSNFMNIENLDEDNFVCGQKNKSEMRDFSIVNKSSLELRIEELEAKIKTLEEKTKT